jgi:hypothetical protein
MQSMLSGEGGGYGEEGQKVAAPAAATAVRVACYVIVASELA